jgi:hypothetical protein
MLNPPLPGFHGFWAALAASWFECTLLVLMGCMFFTLDRNISLLNDGITSVNESLRTGLAALNESHRKGLAALDKSLCNGLAALSKSLIQRMDDQETTFARRMDSLADMLSGGLRFCLSRDSAVEVRRSAMKPGPNAPGDLDADGNPKLTLQLPHIGCGVPVWINGVLFRDRLAPCEPIG